MDLYERWILPRLLYLVMRKEADRRACHLDRKADDLIRAAGFGIDAIEIGYMKGPKPWTFMYQGSASSYSS
jgi:hypothetical protein